MAHALERRVRVHQALHGYEDGHRLVALSAKLKPRDQKTMLLLSDASGAGAGVESSGYLTGYPLADSGFYAIARTWPAIEMERPGCVWTHTLLLEFADLAFLPSMTFLTRAFLRPAENLALKDYSEPLLLAYEDVDQKLPLAFLGTLKQTLTALYEYPREKILCAADEYSTTVAFQIWAQQWPRLRRSFRFCTLAFSDRSFEGSVFDLQFAPLRERSIKQRFSNVVDAEKTEPSSMVWLQQAAEDIISQGASGLRDFLKGLAGDLAGGREMFVPLCQLHEMIPQFEDTPHVIDDAVNLVDSGLPSSSGVLLRSLLVSSISLHAQSVGAQALDFLIQNIGLRVEKSATSQSDSLGKAIWRHNPHAFLDLLDDQDGDWAMHALEALDVSDLAEKVEEFSDLLPRLLAWRPDLLKEPAVWQIRADWNFSVLQDSLTDEESTINAIITAHRSDLARRVIEVFSVAKVLGILSRRLSTQANWQLRKDYSSWFDEAVRSMPPIADYLGSSERKSFIVLAEIALRTSPDWIPNDYGDDPWWVAIQNTEVHPEARDKQILCGYLLARAFGYRSHSQVNLIEYGFDEIYFGAYNNQLCEESWRFLQASLPRSWVQDWDHCRRLRDAITDLFVNRHLPPQGFPRVTRDDSLFAELAKLTADTSRGRKYLKKVLQHLRETSGPHNRIDAIDSLFWW